MPKKGPSEEQILEDIRWYEGRRDLPRVWDQRGGVLPLEKEVLGTKAERAA